MKDLSKLADQKAIELNKIVDKVIKALQEEDITIAEARNVIVLSDRRLAEKINNRLNLIKVSQI